jgi:hypothetical protein
MLDRDKGARKRLALEEQNLDDPDTTSTGAIHQIFHNKLERRIDQIYSRLRSARETWSQS